MRRGILGLLMLVVLGLAAGCGGSDSDITAFQCADGIDNDNDGQIDFPDDSGCRSAEDPTEGNPATATICSDGVDNDNDGLTDHPFDPGCSSASDDNEDDPATPSQCSDGLDNDNDGRLDFPNDPGCVNAADDNEIDPPAPPQCNDGVDNDGDGLVDHPQDTGCVSANDNNEQDPPPAPVCSDNLDNDGDGLVDFPNDPGCTNGIDADETDPATPPACADNADNDNDGLTDFPNDPGCSSAADNDESNPGGNPACSDGQDNDSDGLTDFPNDPGCSSASDDDETDVAVSPSRTRYAMNNQCWAIKANGSDNYLARTGTSYTATATEIANAEPFYLKPTALGKYMLYNRNRELAALSGSQLVHVSRAAATDAAEWVVLGVGDTTEYPPTPEYNVEPTPEQVQTYYNFVDPALEFEEFTLSPSAEAGNLAIDGSGNVMLVAVGSATDNESFSFEPHQGCAVFPEASSNFTGTPFSGTTEDGRVLGHADAHVHISSSEFLGGAQPGHAYHKFGVEHALYDCAEEHGENGMLDLVGGAFGQDFDGHATEGYPEFTEWPARHMLTHEAIYWKWLERSWASGLRVAVNDLVDNETLCELQRNATGDVTRDCNPMNNAGRQAGSMYGMQDYIDAQYGGRGAGFFQIVHDPAAAREVIEDGKMAVVLGIEISNLFNCKLTYSPLRQQEPFEEDGSGGMENSYDCTVTEGLPNSILTQMQRIHDWGVRQVISIHEFDNAFGGNGIFDGLILNLGNRENSGGIPSGDVASIVNLLSPNTDQEVVQEFLSHLPESEIPTGEFWTTYDCPVEGETPGFSGYLWSNSGGSVQDINVATVTQECVPTGQGGRAGGAVPCYPADVRQCNARWMTPAGLYTYGKMMEFGFLFDWDHMEVGMKTQALELAEAQDPPYPFVSTHGTFGGTTVDQATRLLKNGGFLYPSNGSSRGFRNDMEETKMIYESAMSAIPEADRFLFGFGYGTDTNGLSGQTGARGDFADGDAVDYPYTLFSGKGFDDLEEFDAVSGVVFDQPSSRDVDGNIVRTWHQDVDGNAHHGMLSGFVEEIRIEGEPEELRHLFNSAEAFLQTWERTEASKAAILQNGLNMPAGPILRPAPPVGAIAP